MSKPKKQKYIPTGMPFNALFIISAQRDNISPIIPGELVMKSLQKKDETKEDDIINMKTLLKLDNIETPQSRDVLVKSLINQFNCIELKKASVRIKFKAIISKYYYECIYMDTVPIEEWSDRIVALSFFRSLVESDGERVGKDKIGKACAPWDFVNYMLEYSRHSEQKEVELGKKGDNKLGKIGVLNGTRLVQLYTVKEKDANKPKEFASFLRTCVCKHRGIGVGQFHKVKNTTWVPDLMKKEDNKKKGRKLQKIIHPYVQILRELGVAVGGDAGKKGGMRDDLNNELNDDDDDNDEKVDDYDPDRDGIDGWTIIDEQKDGQIKYNLNNKWYILNDDYKWEILPKKLQNQLKREAKAKTEDFVMINQTTGNQDKVFLEPQTYTCGVIYMNNNNLDDKKNATPIICAKPQNGKIHEIDVVNLKPNK